MPKGLNLIVFKGITTFLFGKKFIFQLIVNVLVITNLRMLDDREADGFGEIACVEINATFTTV